MEAKRSVSESREHRRDENHVHLEIDKDGVAWVDALDLVRYFTGRNPYFAEQLMAGIEHLHEEWKEVNGIGSNEKARRRE